MRVYPAGMRITPGQPATFSTTDVCDLSGARAPQLEHWVGKCGLVPLQDSPGRGSHRKYSLTNVIEAAIARELTNAGMSCQQLRTIFGQLHEHVNVLPETLRASATFVRFTEMVDAIVTITGPGPNYAQWRQDVSAFMASWNTEQTPLDDRILHILAGARAAERDAGGKDARQ